MTSSVIASIAEALRPLMSFMQESRYNKRRLAPEICDFVFGNPHEMPLEGIAPVLQSWAEPKDKNWFAYKLNEPEAREPIAASLRDSHGLPFDPDDIFTTPGAFGALSAALRTLCEPGDEAIYLSPPWFFYDAMIKITGAEPVRVALREPDYAPDPELIAAAITPRTKAIIINTPHNPTGRLYTREELQAIADVLQAAPGRIFLLADEAYRRIVYDGADFVSASAVYRDTLVIYTYGKTLLAPGERLGYIALHPEMENREELGQALLLSQMVGGWQFPNATLQRATADLETMSLDIPKLQARRDRLGSSLTSMGYEVMNPASTFYMMVRSPIADDTAFTAMLAEHDVFVGPGVLFEMPGWFRISLTASDEMVERSLPGFAAAIESARA